MDTQNGFSLIVMVGLPLSGKTTIVNAEYLPKGYAVVCPDLVRVAIHGQRFIASAEPFVWATVYAMVDSLLAAGCKVVVDGCHTTKKRREPWVKRNAVFREVKTSHQECLYRAERKFDPEIMPTIDRMADQFEPLDSDEGHAE